jgi:hypothetical protein
METKKILLYGGGAVLVGAVGFFVWSFFQKTDIPVNEKKEDTKPANSGKNPFKPMLNNTFKPIVTPNLKSNFKSDLDSMM